MRRLTVFHPEGVAAADTVRCRKLAKALRQIQELSRMSAWGYRADLTLAHLKSFIKEEQGDFGSEVQTLFRDTMTQVKLQQLQQLFEAEYKRSKNEDEKTGSRRGRIE